MKSNKDCNQERKSKNAARLEEDKLSMVTGGTDDTVNSEIAEAVVSDKAVVLKDLNLYAGETDTNIGMDIHLPEHTIDFEIMEKLLSSYGKKLAEAGLSTDEIRECMMLMYETLSEV